MTYKIKEVKINDNTTAIVSVAFTYIYASELFKNTIKEYSTQAISIAFSGEEITNEKINSIFVSAFEEQKNISQTKIAEKTVDFISEKSGDVWLINNIDDEVLNIMTSNYCNVMREIDTDDTSE